MSAARPITLLIAALGGEGGGVLTNWIVEAAGAEGLPVQSTSIPGVAQRTGATTYYIEILPTPWRALGGKRPVLSLVPGAGDVDIVVASELLEAARVVANGFVSKDRTAVIASTHRIYAMTERLAMGDERLDVGKLLGAIEQQAGSHLLFDMEAAAQQAGSVINAVMLGAIAASGRLPISPERFAAAIHAEGKSVDANLRGFAAGLAAVASSGAAATHKRWHEGPPTLQALEREAAATMPEARKVVVEGLRRLAAYQDLRYAQLYIDRLAAIRDADARAASGGTLLRETARHLALRMSFEDVIRVAQAKIDPARLRRIRGDLMLAPGDPLAVVEFFKPGIEELCSILPPALARPILALARRRGWLGKVHWGMDIRSTSVTGFLRLKLLASLRPWRRRSYRYREEQAAIEAWLGLIAEGAALSGGLALEIALSAGLVKGYGDTHARGVGNFAKIERRLIRPALAGAYPPPAAVDAIAAARVAALADPEGERLEKTLMEIEERGARRAAAE
ncbi:MAG TPA: indolepyruvate oxidoreductase subunit beta family protein [Stellaceae bacterium]|nr:indolepyruvate oxidoreductase subunit beta family protein [Stellaceae bacterium]